MEKIAVISVETFCAKLSITSVNDNDFFAIIDGEKESIKLNLEPDADRFLSKVQIDNTLKVLKNFRKICEMYKVNRVIAVATFVGENKPKNLHSFFDEVFNSCGFRFNILTEEEQNNVLYSSVINTFDLPKGLICHIAPESLHLVCYNRRNVLSQTTFEFGPLTLANMFPLDAENKTENLKKMAEYVEEKLTGIDIFNFLEEEFSLVGSGDYYEDITALVKKYKKYPLDLVNGYVLNNEEVNHVYEQIIQVDVDKSKKIKGTNEARADVFVASIIISQVVAKLCERQVSVVSNRGFVEGLLFSQIIEQSQDKPISDVLGYSMTGLANFFDESNSKHNEQVYNLALLLFKQLRVLHKLPRGYTRILRLAAYMHDCGTRIGYKMHAKNGFSCLLGSDVYGVTHRELLLAAMAVSLHCGGEITVAEFVKYRDIISEEDIDAVKKLGVILRIAEAFDRVKNSVIVDINCDILGDSVIMKTIAVGDNSYEIEKASECGKDFEKNFGKKIEVL